MRHFGYYFVGLWSLCFGMAILIPSSSVTADDQLLAQAPKLPAAAKDEVKSKHGRGHKHPNKHILKLMYEVSNLKHAKLKASIPVTTLTSYDATTAGVVPPCLDQGSCGDCYIFSGTKEGGAAQMVAGVVPRDGKFCISQQYMLDYHPELGGCDGGDEYQVAQIMISEGVPSLADYPGSGQSPGQKKPLTGMTLYHLDSIVMVGSQAGVAATQDIKNYIVVYGYVSVAGDASSWTDPGTGTITGKGKNIDHAIGLFGFDDNHDNGDGTKGAWKMENNWGASWGQNGWAWIAYGADSIGTEAFVGIVNPVTPPPPPPATGAPVVTSNLTATGTVNQPFTYTITASNSPQAYAASGLLQGLSVDGTTGIISGTPTATGTSTVTIGAINASGVGQASLVLTIGTTPPPPNPANGYIVTPPNGADGFPLPADYTITGGPPANLFASYTFKAVKESLMDLSVTTITANNPALEAQRLQVLQLATKAEVGIKTGKVKSNTLNFLGIITALFKIMSDVGSGNIGSLPADFEALLAAFTSGPVPAKQKTEVPGLDFKRMPQPLFPENRWHKTEDRFVGSRF